MSAAEQSFLGYVNLALALGIFALGGLSLISWLRRLSWLLDVASHFRLQYGVCLALGSVLAWWLGNPPLGLLAAVLALVNLLAILPLYLSPRPPRASTPNNLPRRILFANLWQPNQAHAAVLRLVEQTQPDLILLVESNQRWLSALEPLRSAYPYWASEPREDNYGVALLSRWPIQENASRAFSAAGVPSLVALLDLDGQLLQVVCTHPPPPKSRAETRARDEQMENLATLAAGRKTPLILCGDLNLTPWSPVFWRFTRRSGLADSARGFGVQASWPVGKSWMSALLGVPLDHCLVSPEIAILDRRLGPPVGSDHRPLIVDFSIS